jgi:hypothetical protein
MPLAEHLRRRCPGVLTPWYADDAASAGNAALCAEALKFLTKYGPIYGYYPEPEKSYYICKAEDEAQAKVAFYCLGLKVQFVRGKRYLGGFIGGCDPKLEWVKEKVKVWADGVNILASVAKHYPQTAFAGLTISLQNEWQYTLRTVPGVAALFDPVEKAIRSRFLPALLGVDSISAEMRLLMAQGVKQAGLGIRNPVEAADTLFEVSKKACCELVDSLVHSKRLNIAEHRAAVRVASTEARKKRVEAEKAFVTERGLRKGQREAFRLERACEAGIWLTCIPS